MVTTEPAPTHEMDSRAAAIQQLAAKYERGRPDGPIPPWILPPSSCEFLGDLAGLFSSPPVAFEFGSGRSTHLLRKVSVETTSVDHSPEWLYRTEIAASDKRPQDRSFVISLRRRWHGLRLIESFDLEASPEILRALQQSQLILIDSPPNPAKREHILFLALANAPVGAIIMLDDLEIGAVKRFSQRLARQNREAFQFWKVSLDHQLGIFLKIRQTKIRSCPTLRELVGSWLRV